MAFADMARHVHSFPARGKRVRVITDVITLMASAEDTGGAYSLFEIETPPSGGFPTHTQRHDDEGFYVIEGAYTFLFGERQVTVNAGEFLLIPRGTAHGYVNHGASPARMLIIATPGGVQESFFDEAGDAIDRPVWEPDMGRLLAVAPKYGIEVPTDDHKSPNA